MARRFTYASSQYLSANGTPVVAAPFSVACWWRPASTPVATGTILSIGDVDVTNEQWRLSVNTLNRIRWSAQTSAGEAIATYTAVNMSAGTWYLVGGVEESATQHRVYFGSATANNTTSRAPAGADAMRLGAKVASTPSDYADGDIGIVGIWDGVVLTAVDYGRLANGLPFERLYPHRLTLWRLEGDTADWRGRYPFVPGTVPSMAGGVPLLNRKYWLPIWRSPAGSASVQPSGIASGAACGTPSLIGSVVPSAIAPTITFGAAEIEGRLTPTGIESSTVAGTPLLQAIVQPGGIESSMVVSTAVLHGSVLPPGIASASDFGEPVILAGVEYISPSGIASSMAFGVAQVNGRITAVSIESILAAGTPQLQAIVQPGGIESSMVVSTAVLHGFVVPMAVASNMALGEPIVAPGGEYISPVGIGSSMAFGDAMLNGQIVAVGIGSQMEVSTAVLLGILQPTAIASQMAVGTLGLAGIVLPGGIGSAANFGDAILSGWLFPVAIVSSMALGSTAVIQGAPGQIISYVLLDGRFIAEVELSGRFMAVVSLEGQA